MADLIDLDASLGTVAVPSYLNKTGGEPEGWTGLYMNDAEARVRLSHSTLGLLHGCERKFQKTKLLLNTRARDESPATVFGKAVGHAWQYYFVLRSAGHSVRDSIDSSLFQVWLEYWPILEDDRRFQERAMMVMIRSVDFLERMLVDWEIASFNGKPASELGFNLNIDPKYYYVGYVDLVVKHRKTGRHAIVDVKTTSIRGEDLTPVYKFSDQCLGYSIVLDKIVGKDLVEYDVTYWVCQLPGSKSDIYLPNNREYTFPKTLKDRFDWFLKIYLDVNYMKGLENLDAYPKRGSYCQSWGKTCPFFNECQFISGDVPAYYVPDDINYDFTYELSDILTDHMERLRAA